MKNQEEISPICLALYAKYMPTNKYCEVRR